MLDEWHQLLVIFDSFSKFDFDSFLLKIIIYLCNFIIVKKSGNVNMKIPSSFLAELSSFGPHIMMSVPFFEIGVVEYSCPEFKMHETNRAAIAYFYSSVVGINIDIVQHSKKVQFQCCDCTYLLIGIVCSSGSS
jgi:hypothetical protein